MCFYVRTALSPLPILNPLLPGLVLDFYVSVTGKTQRSYAVLWDADKNWGKRGVPLGNPPKYKGQLEYQLALFFHDLAPTDEIVGFALLLKFPLGCSAVGAGCF